MLEKFSKIIITMSSGRKIEYVAADFDRFGDELEHKTENIILNPKDPKESFVYELSERQEIDNKEYITRFEFVP